MTATPVEARSRYSAPAAGCAADVLLKLARTGTALSVGQLAASTGSTKSLVYRVLAELERRRYVTRLDDGAYSLGLATVELGGAFAVQMPLMSSVRRVCRWLADFTEETVNLGILQEDHVLYLMREEGGRSVYALSFVGKLLPANAVALGKALLATLAPERVPEIFADQLSAEGQLASLTESTITSLEELAEDLDRVRVRGYAEELGEAVAGRCCVAVTVPFDAVSQTTVGIGVSMDAVRHDELRGVVLDGLRDARDQITREVNGRAAIGEEPSRTELMIGGMTQW
ncbi:MAG TPA: IclR family transcriptional regulator [Solirubrobacteraceae bacterium]|nr:IclR family transcriptional regulator [Solirubrobacteraceae bacterium]